MFETVPNKTTILQYEVAASWWASWISWGPLQKLASRYFAWKVNRKYRRYLASIEMRKRLLLLGRIRER